MYIGMYNRRVKFGLKIQPLGENVRKFQRGIFFDSRYIRGIARKNCFVKVQKFLERYKTLILIWHNSIKSILSLILGRYIYRYTPITHCYAPDLYLCISLIIRFTEKRQNIAYTKLHAMHYTTLHITLTYNKKVPMRDLLSEPDH